MLKSFDNTSERTEGARLDAMMDRLRRSNDPQTDLLLEHFATARTYLLGEMPEEFALNMKLAREVLPMMEDGKLRDDMSEGITALLGDLRAS
jgi:hypothetical protein